MDGTNVTGPDNRLRNRAPAETRVPVSSLPLVGKTACAPADLRGDRRTDYQPLVILAIATAAGITLDHHAGLNGFAVWPAASICCLIAWSVFGGTGRKRAAAWALLMAAAFAGASWHHLRWNGFDQNEITIFAVYDPQPACIEAVALESPDRVPSPPATPLRAIPAGDRSRLVVNVIGIRDGTVWRPASGRCQLSVDGHLLGVRAGDTLRIFGQLGQPVPPRNPGEFDFAAHARSERQLSVMRSTAPESVSVVARGGSWNVRRKIEALRGAALRLVRDHVGPQRSHLAAAILLGAREGLPYDETEPYLVTGTIHVLVVSGMNVAILGSGLFLMSWAGWLPRKTALALIIAALIGYTLVAEAQPPVVRATVLGILICIAAWTGRHGVRFNSLAAAAVVALVLNPVDLFRPGPQLSFLAVATLIWIGYFSRWRREQSADRLEQMLEAIRPWYDRAPRALGQWNLWLLATSLLVWLTTMPLVLMQFHVASPIAVLVSPIVWLCVVAAMWSGFVMVLFGWLVPFAGSICGAVCNASLAGLEYVVRIAEGVPGGHFWAPGPSLWWIIGFYIGLVAVMVWGRAVAPPRWQVALLAVWTLVGLVPPMIDMITNDDLDCTFIAVGHGTCVLIESPTGETLLYDAGALGSPEYATQAIASYLWHRGIMRIDGLVISHADVDHYNAVPGLLERFSIGAVYVSPVMFERFGASATSNAPEVLRNAIRRAGIPIHEIWAGDRLQVGPQVIAHVFHPPERGVVGSDNANSITLAVECGEHRLLLPGDLESPGLEDVIAEVPYDCDVLLAPHHGSRQSDPPGFAAWSDPEWVVISGGRGEDVAPVIATYKDAGAHVVRTHERGAVRFQFQREDVRAVAWWGGLNGRP